MAEAELTNGSGPTYPAYADSVPTELRSPELAGYMSRFEDAPTFYKSLENAVKYQGRSVAIPGSDPKEIETWKSEHLPKLQHVFADRMPPASPKDYEFKFDGVDGEALNNDKVLNGYREWAHKAGFSKAQAESGLQYFVKDVLPQVLPQLMPPPAFEWNWIDEKPEDLAALHNEVFKGETTLTMDRFKKSIDLINSLIPETKDFLAEGRAPYGQKTDNKAMKNGNHPTMIKIINLVADMLQPDSSAGSSSGSLTQVNQDIISEAEDIMKNKDNPKYAKYWASDKATVDYVNSLWEKAYPGNIQV